MRLPRYRLRTLLLVVGGLAVLLAGGLECRRLKRLSDKYRYIAWAMGNDVRSGLANLSSMEKALAPFKRLSNAERARLSDEDRALLIELPIAIEMHQASIAASANLVLIYEHAASHPWEALPELAMPTMNSALLGRIPVVQRFLAGPPAPAPPRPPEFSPQSDVPPEPLPPPPPPLPLSE
jgi:hypothetical protein